MTILAMILCASISCAQEYKIHLTELEKKYDAVVLIADVRTGELLGGANISRAFKQEYYPGSLFKIAIAVAAVHSGLPIRPTTYTCTGADTIGGNRCECWIHTGHGEVGFISALAKSCNLYFRHLARNIPEGQIVQAARVLGMLSPSGFKGSSERTTTVPTLNDTTILGEGFVVSPAQMLRTALIVASRGRLSKNGEASFVGLRYDPMYEGLRLCVKEGTGTGARMRRFVVAGKTGTTEVSGVPNRMIGWFIGYAPAVNPRYAISVMYRSARGKDAAIIARLALEHIGK